MFFIFFFERTFKLMNVHKSETKNGRELLQREEKFWSIYCSFLASLYFWPNCLLFRNESAIFQSRTTLWSHTRYVKLKSNRCLCWSLDVFRVKIVALWYDEHCDNIHFLFELNIIMKNMAVEQWKNEIDKINVDWFEWIVRNFSGFSIKWFENILC